MNIFNFSDSNSLVTHYLAELRNIDVQKDAMRFRENIKRISFCMAYEISKTLDFTEKEIQSQLAAATVKVLEKPPVIAFVLRAGLAMQSGFVEAFDEADHCFISAYRDEGTIDEIKAHIDYLASPSIEGRTVILIDPMLATGSSLVGGYAAMLKMGKPANLHIACLVAAPEGIDTVQENISGVNTLWLGAIDSGLDEKAYIVPGLGDAGDLAFGTKI